MRYVLHEPVAGECPWWRIFDRHTPMDGRNGPVAMEVVRVWSDTPDAEGVARQALDQLNGEPNRMKDLAQLEAV